MKRRGQTDWGQVGDRRRSGVRSNDQQTGGYILVSVLVVIAVAAGLVSSILLLGRSSIDSLQTMGKEIREKALLDSATAIVGFELTQLKRPWREVDGQQLRLDGGEVLVRVESTEGMVDLNASGKTLLAAAYRAARLSHLLPEEFADRVIDWRDRDDEPRRLGAETSAYLDAGASTRPRNGDFRSLGDLSSVLGVEPADVEQLRPYVTVFNPTGRISPLLAPEALLAQLPGVTATSMKDIAAARRLGDDGIAELADVLLVQSALINLKPPKTFDVTITVRAGLERGQRGAKLVISSDPTDLPPFRSLAWALFSSS